MVNFQQMKLHRFHTHGRFSQSMKGLFFVWGERLTLKKFNSELLEEHCFELTLFAREVSLW
jgi:hypothetical protein